MSTSAPAGGDQNRGPALITFFWTEAALAIVVLALRLYGRLLLKNFGADDYLMIFTVLLFITMAGFANHLADIGGARHLYYLTTAQQLQVTKYDWIAQTFGIAGFATAKTSVALQIRRILGPNNRSTRWLLWIIIILTCIFCGLDCIFGFAQCDPPRALWEPWVPHKCWNTSVQTDFALFISAWNIFMDLVLAAIPIPIIWKTSLSLKQRMATCALLGLGPLAAACGIVKITYVVSLEARNDLTWATFNLDVWSASELFVVIFCGCIPPMRPIFTHHFGSNKDQFKGYTYGSSGYDGSQRGINHKQSATRSSDVTRSRDEEDLEVLSLELRS